MNVVVVDRQTWLGKDSFAVDAQINWVLPPELFVESDQDFNYGLAMSQFFKPELMGEGADENLAQYWFRLNGFASYPQNYGIMRTPVAWFNNAALFYTDHQTNWTQVRIGDGNSGVFWILAAFASVAVINQRS